MNVISDTSPINYLVLIDHIEILPILFAQVAVPPAVVSELEQAETPPAVREWIGNPPDWLLVRSPSRVDQTLKLGMGEVEAVSLAVEMHATLLLTDDRRARRAAEVRGLIVAGTLGVLELATQRRLIELPAAIAKLRETNFHVSDFVLTRILAANAEGRATDGGR